MSSWLFALTPFTPIHIGTGEPIEPYEYVIGDRLCGFDPGRFAAMLDASEQEEFLRLAGSSMLRMRDFVWQRRDQVIESAEYSAAVSSEARRIYEERLTNPKSDLTIHPCIKTMNRAYIPGSSLKGAIRTALLYVMARKPVTERNARRLEAMTFNYARMKGREYKGIRVGDDPFKTIKIGDSQSESDVTRLVAVMVHTRTERGDWRRDVPILREVTLAQLSDNVQIKFTHPVQVNEEMRKHDRRLIPITMQAIIEACREFYGMHLAEEAKYLAGFPEAAKVYATLSDWEAQMPKDAFLVRFGWGSGFDAVTINYARDKREVKRSRRLAEGGIPLGWAQVKVETAD